MVVLFSLVSAAAGEARFNFEKHPGDGTMRGWSTPGALEGAFAWHWSTDKTGTVNTGPDAAHSGVGFCFTEASPPRATGDVFELFYDGSACSGGASSVSFWYSIDGTDMGTLRLREAGGGVVWSRSGDRGSGWSLAGPLHLMTAAFSVEGVRGRSAYSDMAVDDVSVLCDVGFPQPPPPALPPSLYPAASCVAAAECGAWFFPPDQKSAKFLLSLILPSTFTIEARVRHEGATSGTFFFSLEKSSNGNCMMLSASFLPDEDWHVVTMTSAGQTFLDGVLTTSGVYANDGAACAGVASFSLANDQDGVLNVNDAGQASPLHVNYLTIYDVAWSASQTADRISRGCLTTDATRLWGAWYGDSAADRSGNGRPAATMAGDTLSAPASPGATGLSNICASPPLLPHTSTPLPPPPLSPPPPSPPVSPNHVNTIEDLRDAMLAAANGVTLFLPAGAVYYLSGVQLEVTAKNLTLASTGEGAVLDGQSRSRLFQVRDSNLVLHTLHLRNGASDEHNGESGVRGRFRTPSSLLPAP